MVRRHPLIEHFLIVLLVLAMATVLFPASSLASETSEQADTQALASTETLESGEQTLVGCRAVIETSRDEGDPDDALSGELTVGQTVWANVYQAIEGEDGASCSYESVAADDAWTYQWLSSPSASASPEDYELVEGATSQSLTIDASLAGSYLSCRIYDGTTTLYANASGQVVSVTSSSAATSEAAAMTLSATNVSSGNDEESVTASCWVIGPDETGSTTTWVPVTSRAVKAGTTAADLTKQLLDENGITYDADLYTFTKDGRSVGWDSSTGKWWQLFINGESASVMASNYVLEEGDQVAWYYSAWGDSLLGQVTGTVKVIGKDASGLDQVWLATTSETLSEGSTAADLSEAAFASAGLVHSSSTSSWGYYLSTITSPEDGRELVWDDSTGAYWHLFVNGEVSQVGASGVTISSGDEIVWYYCTDSDSLPKSDALVVDPTAERPMSYESDWPGYKGTGETGVVRDVSTPIPQEGTNAKLEWSQSRLTTGRLVDASDAIIVNGDVYDAAQSQVFRRSSETGEVLGEARLAASIDSTARLQYADGLILVPLHGGRIQALTADTLTTVWVSPELDTSTSASGGSVDQQLLSSITVRDGKAYFTTVAPDGSDSCGGYVACVSLEDGSLVWSHANEEGVGYYWTGAVLCDAGVLTADDNGRVSLLDAQTGQVISTLELGERCRAQLSVSGDTVYAVTTDGTLREIELGSDGTLAAGRSVRFGSYSTSSPTICDGLAYVGGASSSDMTRGALFVIDLSTMTVRHEVLVPLTSVEGQVGTGDVKSAPLVSVASDGTMYVYFTSNGKPGGVYAYKLGESFATTLFIPDQSLWQYCMSSVACDGEGNLYYYNDSGTLFKLSARERTAVPTETERDATGGQDGSNAAAGSRVAAVSATEPEASPKRVQAGTSGTSSEVESVASEGATSLLDAFSSEDVSSTTSETSSLSNGMAETLGASSGAGLPVWPIVGTCVGVGALVALLVTRRRRDAEGRRI